jgi:hypothetical protein
MAIKIDGTTIVNDERDVFLKEAIVYGENARIKVSEASPMQGEVAGFASGQEPGNQAINRFTFSNEAVTTTWGNLAQARDRSAGQSSDTHGFTSGGGTVPFLTRVNTIDRFAFASSGNAADYADLTQTRFEVTGQSSITDGYSSGGYSSAAPAYTNVIDKFPFASNTNATDVGDLTQKRSISAGQSSITNGYSSGGYSPDPGVGQFVNTIDKFSFASNGNASDVGNSSVTRGRAAGCSSTTHGYTSGGQYAPSKHNVIDKFSFAADGNATDVGDLTGQRQSSAGISSIANGYIAGGVESSNVNTIDKFPFSSDASAAAVGSLTSATGDMTGQQD